MFMYNFLRRIKRLCVPVFPVGNSIDWLARGFEKKDPMLPCQLTGLKGEKKNNNIIPTWFVFPTFFFFSRFWLCSKYLRRPVTKSRHFLVLSSGSMAELIWLFFLSFWFFAQLSRFVIHQHYPPPSPFPIQLMPSLPNPDPSCLPILCRTYNILLFHFYVHRTRGTRKQSLMIPTLAVTCFRSISCSANSFKKIQKKSNHLFLGFFFFLFKALSC